MCQWSVVLDEESECVWSHTQGCC